jgi:hypothetical protein
MQKLKVWLDAMQNWRVRISVSSAAACYPALGFGRVLFRPAMLSAIKTP